MMIQKLCSAKCKGSDQMCQSLAMANGRCRVHGGLSTGAPIKHGQRSKAAIAQRKADHELIASLQRLGCLVSLF